MNRRLNGQFEFAWQVTLAQKTHAQPPPAAKRADLATLDASLVSNRAQLDAQQSTVQAYFAQTQSDLKTHQAVSAIQARAQAQAAQYAQLYAQMTKLLSAIPSAKTDADYKAAVAAATTFLHNHSSKPKRAKFDPQHLAFGPPKERARKALTDPAAIRAALGLSDGTAGSGSATATVTTKSSSRAASTFALTRVPAKLLVVASNKKSRVIRTAKSHPQATQTATLPPNLSPTEDVQITPAIMAKAQALNNNPLAIYQFVRNNVEYLPTYGSIEGSDYTLQTLRGNDIDQASLLIALLRAANIPAHYVYGTIQVPIAQVENWVGGVTDPNAALDLMGQGGIPTLGLTRGGVIGFAQIEHVWVEAQIGFAPSRGAKTTPGTTWVPMDPSFKQYTYTSPLNVQQVASMNLAGDLSAAVAHASATDSSITGIDGAYIKDRLAIYQQNMQAYPNSQGLPLTLQQAFGGRTIVEEKLPILAGSLPYATVAIASRIDVLPDSLRHAITIELYASAYDQSLGSPYLTKTVSLPALELQRLGITYVPATSDDAAILQGLTGTSIPLYEVSVKPEIRLDDTVIAQGAPIGMGQDQPIDVVLDGPLGQQRLSYLRIAGDEMVVGVDGAGMSFDDTSRRKLVVPADSAAENLFQLSINYWAESDLMNDLSKKQSAVASARLPSAGIFSSPLSVTYNFGIPTSGSYLERNIDLKLSRVSAASSNPQQLRSFIGTTGIAASYLESSIQEQLFRFWQGTGLSTAQSFADANAQAIPIFDVDSGNASSVLPSLQLPQSVMGDIADGIAAGYEIIVPQTTPAKPAGAQGVGYEILDPMTGGATYRIESGAAGGDSSAPCQVPQREPLVQAISDIVKTLIVVAIIAAIVAGIAWGTGGTAAPALASIVAAVMTEFGLTSLAFAATAGGPFCNPRPVPQYGKPDPYHDRCAATREGSLYPGLDVCVVAPIAGQKQFDAYNGSILWEVKTYNYANQGSHEYFFNVIILGQDKPNWQKEKAIAHECGKQFWYAVGDPKHVADLNIAEPPSFVPNGADNLELDPVNCLQP